jgi:uncharacterized membrane-anchored protein
MVDVMSNLPAVREAAKDLGATVKFNPGSRYADFNSSTDKLADYGLAGLVAAGVGVAVAKKAGLLAILLIFFKKAIAFIIAGGAARLVQAEVRRRLQGRAFDEQPAEQLPPAE